MTAAAGEPSTQPTPEPASPAPSAVARAHVEFCDEWTEVVPPGPFRVGREGDLVIDDSPYLHRSFLELRWDQFWWLHNVGNRLAATITDGDGTMHAWLAPGTALPLVFSVAEVRFTAGPTNYAFSIHLSEAPLSPTGHAPHSEGTTTLHPVLLSTNQRRCVVALAEPVLRHPGAGTSAVPSSADAAGRLGWTVTRFNRQLDTVCQKLETAGVQGLHGDGSTLARGRKARLVEYALAVQLVTPDDLPLLDEPS